MKVKIPASSLSKFKGPIPPATQPEFDTLLESASIDVELPLGVAARLERMLTDDGRLLELIEELDVDDRTCFAALHASIAESLPGIIGRNLLEIRPERCDLESLLCDKFEDLESDQEKKQAICSLRECLPNYDDPSLEADRGGDDLAQSFRIQLDNGVGWENAEVKLTSIPWRKLRSMSFDDILGEVGELLEFH